MIRKYAKFLVIAHTCLKTNLPVRKDKSENCWAVSKWWHLDTKNTTELNDNHRKASLLHTARLKAQCVSQNIWVVCCKVVPFWICDEDCSGDGRCLGWSKVHVCFQQLNRSVSSLAGPAWWTQTTGRVKEWDVAYLEQEDRHTHKHTPHSRLGSLPASIGSLFLFLRMQGMFFFFFKRKYPTPSVCQGDHRSGPHG